MLIVVEAAFSGVPGVLSVHDVHVWALDPANRILSTHVVVEDSLISETASITKSLRDVAYHRFKTGHTIIQVECTDCGQDCVDASP